MEGLNELLATSQKLPTQVGLSGVQLKRGVAELDEASKALGASSSVLPPGQDLMGAVRLLSQRNFDAVRWSQDVENLSVQTPYFPSEHLEATDIEGYLTHHHDMIILNAINEAKRGAEYDVREMHRRWASNEWATSKRQFLDSLGHRALRDLGLKGTVYPGGSAPSALALMSSPSPMSPYNRGAGGGGAFPAAVAVTPSITSRMNAMMGDASADLSVLLKNQAAIVRALNQSVAEMTVRRTGAGAMGGCPCPCASLAKAIAIPQENVTDPNGLTTRDLINYQGMLEMLSDVVGEQTSSNPPPAGYFSTICFDPEDVASTVLTEKRKILTAQTLRYLEELVWKDMSVEVDTAVRENQLSLPPCRPEESKVQRVRAYVQLLRIRGSLVPVGTHASAGGSDISIFALVYYYLRVGMLSHACDEIQQGVRKGIKSLEAVATCLTIFSTIAGATSPNVLTLPPQKCTELLTAMHACGTLFDEERQKGRQGCDPYRACVLNLLSMRDQTALSEFAAELEDFLWSNLWFIQWSQLLGKVTAGASTQRAKECSEMDLHDQVLSYGGADHFGAGISGPFNYARVLFCCHRFGDAIAHLWHTGKSLPAAHLTVVCLHYGLILPHQPLAHNPRRAHVAISSGVLTPAALFQAFFQAYLPIGQHPKMCVDYLASLNLHWFDHVSGIDASLFETQKLKCQNAKAEVFQMLLMNMARDQLTELVGTPREDVRPGEDALIRTSGWLDTYMSPATVTALLTLAAHQQLTVRRDGGWAIVLFQLAGRHSDVLEELCNKLSEAMATGDSAAASAGGGSDANYWKNTSVEYHNQFIKTGDTTVTRYLEVDQRSYLVGTFETLLNLAVFIESAWAGQYREAFNVLDQLSLFPQNSEEVSPAAQQFPTLDKYIRRVADQTLMLAVESAKALFIQLRSETTGGAGMGRGIVTERDIEVLQLKERVKSLVMFASMVRSQLNNPNTPIIMARIEDSLS